MPGRPAISPLELEVLQFIADRGHATAGQAAKHFATTRGYARSTIVTIMDRARTKGYLTRKKVDGVYRYSPRFRSADVQKSLVRDFVDKTLRGSVSPFVAYLLDHGQLDDADLDQLSRLVEEMRRQREEGER